MSLGLPFEVTINGEVSNVSRVEPGQLVARVLPFTEWPGFSPGEHWGKKDELERLEKSVRLYALEAPYSSDYTLEGLEESIRSQEGETRLLGDIEGLLAFSERKVKIDLEPEKVYYISSTFQHKGKPILNKERRVRFLSSDPPYITYAVAELSPPYTLNESRLAVIKSLGLTSEQARGLHSRVKCLGNILKVGGIIRVNADFNLSRVNDESRSYKIQVSNDGEVHFFYDEGSIEEARKALGYEPLTS